MKYRDISKILKYCPLVMLVMLKYCKYNQFLIVMLEGTQHYGTHSTV